MALRRYGCPFEFSEDMETIGQPDSGEGPWPKEKDRRILDFGILAKMKQPSEGGEPVHLILAGLGMYGTLGACHYLESHTVELFDEFSTDPFACLISVERDVGYSSAQLFRKVRIRRGVGVTG